MSFLGANFLVQFKFFLGQNIHTICKIYLEIFFGVISVILSIILFMKKNKFSSFSLVFLRYRHDGVSLYTCAHVSFVVFS